MTLRVALAALAYLAMQLPALAQAFPDKPIRIISGTQTGTSGDIANLPIHRALWIGELGGARAEVLIDAVFRLAHLRGGGRSTTKSVHRKRNY